MDRKTRTKIQSESVNVIRTHGEAGGQGPGEVTELINIVEKKITSEGVDDQVQIELATVLNLLAKMEKEKSISSNKRNLKLALKSLASDQPNLSFVRGLRSELEWNSNAYSRGLPKLIRRIAGPSPISAMVSGILTSLIFFPLIYVFVVTQFETGLSRHFNLPTLNILVGGAFVGGIVSILSRLDKFGTLRLYNPNLVFLTAFWKPMIGVALSMFTYSIFASDFIQISGFDFNTAPPTEVNASAATPSGSSALPNQNAHHKHYLIVWALGFLCGFSERFTRDLVRGVENKVIPGSSDAPR